MIQIAALEKKSIFLVCARFAQFCALSVLFFVLCTQPIHADTVDTDQDGISDYDEIHVYHTDPNNPDTDGDGYPDGVEVKRGFSPLHGNKKRLSDVDTDGDGLSDLFEIQFGTDLTLKDTDSDGFSDKNEIWAGFDPRTKEPKRVTKKIEVSLAKQRLKYYVNDVVLHEAVISSGKWNWPTPVGEFKIINKDPRAWSKLAGLWMPYWMGFAGGKFGIHDLPEWPNGKKEGLNHLGRPVSHGCVRLSSVEAKALYAWTPIGTKLIISK